MKVLIISASLLLVACGGGGSDNEGPPKGRLLVPGEVCRAQMDRDHCIQEFIWRKPLDFQHCTVPLDDQGMCRYDDLVHNVPNLGQLQ